MQQVSTVVDLKNLIREQWRNDIDDGHFDVGIMEGVSVVNFVHMKEFWAEAKKGSKVFLWCNALIIRW